MRDKNWIKFEASGRVDDYLNYCRNSHNGYNIRMQERDDRNEDDDANESELYADRDGAKFHARWRV